MKRRNFLAATTAALAMPALAQNKPDKLVYVGDNGPWHSHDTEELYDHLKLGYGSTRLR